MMTELKRLGVLENRYDVSDVVGLEVFYIASVAYHLMTQEFLTVLLFRKSGSTRQRKQKSSLTFSILARSSMNSLSFTLLAIAVEMIYKLSRKLELNCVEGVSKLTSSHYACQLSVAGTASLRGWSVCRPGRVPRLIGQYRPKVVRGELNLLLAISFDLGALLIILIKISITGAVAFDSAAIP